MISVAVNGATYYVSTTGNDGNPGNINNPWKTWQKGFETIVAGDILYIRGGTYLPTGTFGRNTYSGVFINNKDGLDGNPIRVFAYPGETPVLDCRNLTQVSSHMGIYLYGCDFWHLKGLTVTRADQSVHNGTTYYGAGGIYVITCNNVTVERCVAHHNGGGGISANFECNNTLFLNCDSYGNADPNSALPYDHADGFGMEEAASGLNNTIRGCRSWFNSDDGYDMFDNNGNVTIDSCWAWGNGYLYQTTTHAGNGQGIKLGRTDDNSYDFRRSITNCLTFYNYSTGIIQNAANVKMYIYNNTSYHNNNIGIELYSYDLPHIIRNNISFLNTNTNYNGVVSAATVTNNTNGGWQPTGTVVTAADFMSLDTTGVSGPRQANGTLPILNFLRLDSASNLIDKGFNIGKPFYGTAPDIGAYEYTPFPVSAKLLLAPNKNVNVYPNPVSDELIIKIEDNIVVLNFEIINSLGKVIYKGELLEKIFIQTKDFVPGIYTIKIENGNSFIVKKFIKL